MDGNIRYFHGKHIALFLVSLLTILIFLLPYTHHSGAVASSKLLSKVLPLDQQAQDKAIL